MHNMSDFHPNDACPECAVEPLIVTWEYGTLQFACFHCGTELEPSAQTLISLLPEKR